VACESTCALRCVLLERLFLGLVGAAIAEKLLAWPEGHVAWVRDCASSTIYNLARSYAVLHQLVKLQFVSVPQRSLTMTSEDALALWQTVPLVLQPALGQTLRHSPSILHLIHSCAPLQLRVELRRRRRLLTHAGNTDAMPVASPNASHARVVHQNTPPRPTSPVSWASRTSHSPLMSPTWTQPADDTANGHLATSQFPIGSPSSLCLAIDASLALLWPCAASALGPCAASNDLPGVAISSALLAHGYSDAAQWWLQCSAHAHSSAHGAHLLGCLALLRGHVHDACDAFLQVINAISTSSSLASDQGTGVLLEFAHAKWLAFVRSKTVELLREDGSSLIDLGAVATLEDEVDRDMDALEQLLRDRQSLDDAEETFHLQGPRIDMDASHERAVRESGPLQHEAASAFDPRQTAEARALAQALMYCHLVILLGEHTNVLDLVTETASQALGLIQDMKQRGPKVSSRVIAVVWPHGLVDAELNSEDNIWSCLWTHFVRRRALAHMRQNEFTKALGDIQLLPHAPGRRADVHTLLESMMASGALGLLSELSLGGFKDMVDEWLLSKCEAGDVRPGEQIRLYRVLYAFRVHQGRLRKACEAAVEEGKRFESYARSVLDTMQSSSVLIGERVQALENDVMAALREALQSFLLAVQALMLIDDAAAGSTGRWCAIKTSLVSRGLFPLLGDHGLGQHLGSDAAMAGLSMDYDGLSANRSRSLDLSASFLFDDARVMVTVESIRGLYGKLAALILASVSGGGLDCVRAVAGAGSSSGAILLDELCKTHRYERAVDLALGEGWDVSRVLVHLADECVSIDEHLRDVPNGQEDANSIEYGWLQAVDTSGYEKSGVDLRGHFQSARLRAWLLLEGLLAVILGLSVGERTRVTRGRAPRQRATSAEGQAAILEAVMNAVMKRTSDVPVRLVQLYLQVHPVVLLHCAVAHRRLDVGAEAASLLAVR
jgi:hypothetical protein